MTHFWQQLQKPIIALAPMDGYTDQPFRLLVREIEPRAVLFTEFLSADGIVHGAKTILHSLNLLPEEAPLVVQIFGKEPEILAKAAVLIEQRGANAVDVNMGCPAKKVVNSLHGSALMKDIDRACRIVDTMKKAVNIPVSVKTRLGWENSESLIPFVKRLIDAGLDHITIHGRTYSQAFKGEAQWEDIYELKKSIPITVLGNGDVQGWESARDKINNLDGVMVGRSTFGNPWVIKEVAKYLLDGEIWDSKQLSFLEKAPVIKRHIELSERCKGGRGMLEIRKHLASYVRGVHSAASFRMKLVTVESAAAAIALIEEIEELEREREAAGISL